MADLRSGHASDSVNRSKMTRCGSGVCVAAAEAMLIFVGEPILVNIDQTPTWLTDGVLFERLCIIA